MLPTFLFLLLAPATEVIRYQPPSSLPSKKQNGSCWTASIAAPYRTDAWRCTVGTEIHDPCFVTAKRGRLLCDMNPASGARGFVLSLSKTLPERKGPAPNAPTVWAWLVELEDGARSQPFTSTRPFLDGEAARYSCSSTVPNQNVVLIGEISSTGPIWTARRAVLGRSEDGPSVVQAPTSVPLKKVWQ